MRQLGRAASKTVNILAYTLVLLGAMYTSYAAAWVLNNPYPESESKENIYYSSFNEQPKTLDPARSYSSNEYIFIGQIYEPLLEYDYFKRPSTDLNSCPFIQNLEGWSLRLPLFSRSQY